MHPKIDLKQLPPLKALKGFEAATRHQSIRDAADELCLTHPAVSHQVQLVEDALGVTLFVQEGRHIVSTEEGKVLYPYVRAAFESLLEGVEALKLVLRRFEQDAVVAALELRLLLEQGDGVRKPRDLALDLAVLAEQADGEGRDSREDADDQDDHEELDQTEAPGFTGGSEIHGVLVF